MEQRKGSCMVRALGQVVALPLGMCLITVNCNMSVFPHHVCNMKDLDEIIFEIPSNSTATTTIVTVACMVYHMLATMPGAALSTVRAVAHLIRRPRQWSSHTLETPPLATPSLWDQKGATTRAHTPFLDQGLTAKDPRIPCLSGPGLLLGLAGSSSSGVPSQVGLRWGRVRKAFRPCRLGGRTQCTKLLSGTR